jgi:Ankyrin repeats (3 copies)
VNLEQLRKQAKELVRAARAGDPEALERLGGRELILARAQLVLARAHGYASWPALVAAAEADADGFVLAATEGHRTRAEAMLAGRPEIARDPWVRLVLGRGFEGDPSAPGGPRAWAPLLYATHSLFAPVDTARELLARGADPNAFFVNEYGRMSALYGAAGRLFDPELTRLLLEAGADPDDGESVYHATAAPSPECLALLLEHGAHPTGTSALAAALDGHRTQHVRLLLEAEADPNEGALMAHAVRRGCPPELLELLAAHGTEVDRPGGETWRGNVPLRTPYQHAVLRGRDDAAATLRRLGAATEVAPRDRALAAVARGEAPAAPLPAELDVDAQEVLVLAALDGRLDAVVAAVGPDFRGVVGGSPVLPLIGHAAWVGSREVVAGLLARGADPWSRGDAEWDTPLAVAVHGSQEHRGPASDYVAVAELLLAAGNELEPRFLEIAEGPLYAWLEARLGSG